MGADGVLQAVPHEPQLVVVFGGVSQPFCGLPSQLSQVPAWTVVPGQMNVAQDW
jgi:hypothetical protein